MVNNNQQTTTEGASCNCPSWIFSNSYCTFQFAYSDVTSFTNTPWTGSKVLTLANGGKISVPVGGYVSGRMTSSSLSSRAIACTGGNATALSTPPSMPSPPPPVAGQSISEAMSICLTLSTTLSIGDTLHTFY